MKLIHSLGLSIIAIRSDFTTFDLQYLLAAVASMFDEVASQLLVFQIQLLQGYFALIYFKATPSLYGFHSNGFGLHLVVPPEIMACGGDGNALCQRVKPCLVLVVLGKL